MNGDHRVNGDLVGWVVALATPRPRRGYGAALADRRTAEDEGCGT